MMLQVHVDSSESESDSDDDSSDEGDEPFGANGDEETNIDGIGDSGPMVEPGGGVSVPRKNKRTREEMAYMKMQMALDDEYQAGFGGPGIGTRMQNYDTYLKDAGSRNRSFFKSSNANPDPNELVSQAAQQQQQQVGGRTKFKMFPYYERRRKVDTYGEEIDVGTWLRRGKELEDMQNQNEEQGGSNVDPDQQTSGGADNVRSLAFLIELTVLIKYV
jgi:cleavage and polyadenylation specificity factor subunit 2